MLTPAAFFKIAYRMLRNAEEQKKTIRRFYNIANYITCISFTHEDMVPIITPALEHLRIAPQPLWDHMIYIGDHVSVGTPLTMLRGYEHSIRSRGEIGALSDENILTLYNHHDGALNLINLSENISIYWVRSIKHMPWWVAGSPLQRIIGCWMRNRHLELTHAAAVGYREGGVLLAGKSGSGKSTTTITCMEADFFYVGEDYCVVDNRDVPCVHSVYNSTKIEPHTLERFPHLKSLAVNKSRQSWEKALLFQHQIQPNRILSSLPLKAVLVLSVGKKTVLDICTPGQAAMALSVSTICQLSAAYHSTLAYYAILLKKIPCYHLTVGPSRTSIIKKIHAVIAKDIL